MHCHLCSKKVSEDTNKKDLCEFLVTCDDCHKKQTLYLFDIEQANKKIETFIQNLKSLNVNKDIF